MLNGDKAMDAEIASSEEWNMGVNWFAHKSKKNRSQVDLQDQTQWT